MSAQPPSTRRLAIAIGTAATSATIAIGVTAASLLGWFSPSPVASSGPDPASETSAPTPTPAPSPVVLVPVSPTPAPPPATEALGDVQLALDDRGRGGPYVRAGDDDDRHDGREHHDEDGDDDD